MKDSGFSNKDLILLIIFWLLLGTFSLYGWLYGIKYRLEFNDEQGLIVELESGNYVPASKLSIGTIDQLYLSLRLSMIDELSEENLPIILDEAFAYYDTERLTNILKYLDEKYKTHQIILFTCTNREKEILEKIKVPYNLIEL